MAFLVCLMLLATLLFQHTAGLPVLERSQADMESITRSKSSHSNKRLLTRDFVDGLSATKRSSRKAGLQTRQLGDIEFSNRYAEYLSSKAKQTSICSFLRRTQSVKKSGLGGDTERVNMLLKQYMCPNAYQ